MDETFMREALKLAKEAFNEGEVPVGCVIVRGEEIVGRGRNRREGVKNALAHAEVEAINDACQNLGGWRLWECTLYVTLEPCHVRRGHCERKNSPGGLRRVGRKMRRGALRVQSVRHEIQPPPQGGSRGAGK